MSESTPRDVTYSMKYTFQATTLTLHKWQRHLALARCAQSTKAFPGKSSATLESKILLTGNLAVRERDKNLQSQGSGLKSSGEVFHDPWNSQFSRNSYYEEYFQLC